MAAVSLKSPIGLTVGIITMPAGELAPADNPDVAFITEANVDWFRDVGVEVLSIPYTASLAEVDHYFNSINGLYLQGGPSYEPRYFKLVKAFLQKAVNANRRGDYFPVWGTCHGFQMLIMLIGRMYPLEDIDSLHDFKGKLTLMPDAVAVSRLLHDAPESFINDMQERGRVYFSHEHGITVETFRKNRRLVDSLHVLTTTRDRGEKEYVSSVEAKHFPFYGVQYHPEIITPHFDYFRDFFIEEMKKNKHHGRKDNKFATMLPEPCLPGWQNYHIVFGNKKCYVF